MYKESHEHKLKTIKNNEFEVIDKGRTFRVSQR